MNEKVEFFNEKRIPIESDIRESGQYPYYGATGIIDYVKDYIFDGEYVLLAEDGANILTRNSPIAYITEGRFWLNNHAHIMKMKIGTNYFLLQLLERINYEKFNSGTAQPKLNSQVVKNMVFNFPSEEEQSKTGSFFKQLDETITLHQRKLDQLNRVKQFFLQNIFLSSGKKLPIVRFANFKNKWEQRKLGETSDVRDGTHESPKYIDEGFPLVTSKNLKSYGLDLSEVSLISYKDFESINTRSKVDIGDILFGMIGTIGNPVLVNREDFAIKNVALIKENQNVINTFLIQLLKSPVFKKYIAKENAGGTQKFLSLKKIRNFEFLYPCLDEQNKISTFFIQIDKAITLHQQKLDKLNQLKSAYLQKMFI